MSHIPVCLPPLPETRAARLAVPERSVHTHTHVFVDGYPLSPDRDHHLPDADVTAGELAELDARGASGIRLDLDWVKLSAPYRLGIGDLRPWPELVPLARAPIAADRERMLWGADWPHPNKFETQPNDADLLEQLELWAPDEETRTHILVTNPTHPYGL